MDSPPKPSPQSHSFFYFRTVIFLTLFSVALLHLLSSIPALYRSINRYKVAREVQYLNNISDNLFTAVENYGFERGRVNVVLNDAGPVDKMDGNRTFILARRVAGDNALKNALAQLTALKTDQISTLIDSIHILTEEVRLLREKTARNLVIPKERREKGLTGPWFAKMTEYIESIDALLVTISSNISDADGMISRYSSLKHQTLCLRNTAGPERSILSATMLSGKPIKPSLVKKITNLQVSTGIHLQTLSDLCQPLTNRQIPQALDDLKKVYVDNYLPYREEIFPLALHGGPYPYSQAEFLSHGVRALQQIALFMDSVVEMTHNYADRKVAEGREQIIIQLSCTIGSLALILLIFLYVNYRVVSPIGHVTSSIRRLARKDLDVEVPFQDAPNEIGEMARAVEILKGMAHQLDEDVVALESASVERERLIAELQETLQEINVLRGILPICSICKNIRNDEGYYEQIEEYIHKHSGVDFSHTICPECAEKHYSKFLPPNKQ